MCGRGEIGTPSPTGSPELLGPPHTFNEKTGQPQRNGETHRRGGIQTEQEIPYIYTTPVEILLNSRKL